MSAIPVTAVDLSVNVGGIALKNPVMVASGTFGYGPEYADLVDINRLGAIVVKGICLNPTKGNPTPRTAEVASGLLNAIGLPGPGVDGFVRTYMPFLRQYATPVIVNIWGKTIEEYAEVARRFDQVEGIAGLEVNVSCPNIKEGSALFGTDLDMFRRVVDAIRAATRLPMIPKLAPNVADITAFAKAAEASGANAISLINSFPGMAVDIKTRKPKLANITGGLTGPAIRPIAVRLVWQAAKAVSIPVIGMGGIGAVNDALEFFLVGARAVAVGTANFTNPAAAVTLVDDLRAYLAAQGMASLDGLVGTFAP
ncbi:MAG TPA: dihydroorotate dehydrogenase [Kiritimatiellia bacterium]|nr:dihydroorotate dehydrogenase [Kiritimatiellia bacterium]HMP35286.1 dihydroorotate dehydrogenase [Kiritimatiellia bacterium]